MLDLKTGRFVINAEKGWEFHPFMSRKEFFESGLFKQSEHSKNSSEINATKKYFHFPSININGYEMNMSVHVGGLHDCVKNIWLVSTKLMEIPDINCMPDNWREIAYEVKRIHDEFLQKETAMSPSDIDKDKENSFSLSWGSFGSSFCLRYDMPSADIEISYDNFTEEDKAELDKISDDILWG
ncbi:MAG: hypothetical protein IKP37_05835 [Paludibacteraceae bacterium]|nr:hypothetical protein [Paludibacteraceae bacterium]